VLVQWMGRARRRDTRTAAHRSATDPRRSPADPPGSAGGLATRLGNRRLCYVEASTIAGKAKWSSIPDGASFEITRGIRDVLLGATPAGVTLTRRAVASLDGIRNVRAETLVDGAFIIARDDRDDWRWWTWAGAKENRTLGAWIPSLVVPRQMSRADSLRLHRDLTVPEIREGLATARAANASRPLPAVDKVRCAD